MSCECEVEVEVGSAGQARVLKLLLAINAVMFLVESVTGIIAQSAGLVADSLDMLADAAVYGIGLYAVGRSALRILSEARRELANEGIPTPTPGRCPPMPTFTPEHGKSALYKELK